MNGIVKAGYFNKVSYEQFAKDINPDGELEEDKVREIYDKIPIPKRATTGSAGYDFKAPYSFTLEPGESIKFPTGINAKINDGWFLACFPRSGLGFKYQVRLANTVGVIDSDYILSDNEGHIFAKLVNGGNEPVEINAGDGFMQGIFIPFGISYDDDATATRNGGFGSTGR